MIRPAGSRYFSRLTVGGGKGVGVGEGDGEGDGDGDACWFAVGAKVELRTDELLISWARAALQMIAVIKMKDCVRRTGGFLPKSDLQNIYLRGKASRSLADRETICALRLDRFYAALPQN